MQNSRCRKCGWRGSEWHNPNYVSDKNEVLCLKIESDDILKEDKSKENNKNLMKQKNNSKNHKEDIAKQDETQGQSENQNNKPSSNKKKVLSVFGIILLILILPGLDQSLHVRSYQVEAAQIENKIRIVLVTDLHSCKYGKEQNTLLKKLREAEPDLVFLVGDIFDDKLADNNTEIFLKEIHKDYECYYVTGNHEYWCERDKFNRNMAYIEEIGITRLEGECEELTVHGETINLCGVDDPDICLMPKEDGSIGSFSEELERVNKLSQNGNYTILLSHRPEYFDQYKNRNFDLVLCGHAHGGQWRIPGIINGLLAPNQGVFPKYAGGRYDTESSSFSMIVSRGLARESTLVPRFYNPPELVVIDIE